jgi:hypothetical protein
MSGHHRFHSRRNQQLDQYETFDLQSSLLTISISGFIYLEA